MSIAPSRLPVDAHGRVLDKLAALEAVFPPHALERALDCAGLSNQRSCNLTHPVMLWVVLAMGFFSELPIRQVFKQARRVRRHEPTPHRSSLCLGRKRLGVAPLRHLFDQVVQPLARTDLPGGFYKDLRLVALDATIYNVPDSQANALAFGRPAGSRADGAFPQIRKVGLIEVGTHVELAFVCKGIKVPGSDERSLAEKLFGHLKKGQLLLWDRGFISYELWGKTVATGAEVLGRATCAMVLPQDKVLPDGSYLSRLHKNSCDRDRGRNGLVVRVIEYTLDDPQRAGNGQKHVLVTTLLDADACPATELIVLYHERWEIELVWDEQKTHQCPWQVTKSGDLKSETPVGVEQELYFLSLTHYAVRALMVAAAEQVTDGPVDPDRLSFLGCLRVLRCRLAECTGDACSWQEWLAALLWEMVQEINEPRRNRINPRVVKVKMSKFKKKRAEHRPAPPLSKTFEESIVLLC